jgi:hypothetical protein
MRQYISGVLIVATSALLAGQTTARYDRAAEKTIAGTIKAVASYPTPDGAVGVHLDLATADGLVSIHVGPAMYIGQQNFWFFADDRVEIVGARVPHDDNTPFWAKAIIKGSATLVLRNDDGTPRWAPATDGTDGCGVAHPPLQRATEF